MIGGRARIAAGGPVAIFFGPERTGLENPEVARANAIVSVPVNPEFPSLNLAQAVLLCAYEWGRQGSDQPAMAVSLAGTEPASAVEVAHLGDHYERVLEAAGFFFPAHKADSMKLHLRNLWSRMPFTRADVQTLHGMLRQILRRGPADPGQGD